MPRVFIALSGGVDSGAAALVLKKTSYDLTGVTLRLFDNETSDQAIADAVAVCSQLDIPHQIVDVIHRFKSTVIEPFCNYYLQGLTPSPCLGCNPYFKWKAILDRPGVQKEDKIATGHYAGIKEWNGRLVIRRGLGKDQSYFLHRLNRGYIERTLFPIGDYNKPELREMVAAAGLSVAHRPDSQEVCFVPGSYTDFLRQNLPAVPPPGDIVDSLGRIRGQHRGLHHYTVGQRSGLGISAPNPLYVLKIDAERNRLIVGEKAETVTHQFAVHGCVWSGINPPIEETECLVQVRFRHTPIPCIVTPDPHSVDRWLVHLTEGTGAVISPGQGAAFFHDDVLLGGGEIRYV